MDRTRTHTTRWERQHDAEHDRDSRQRRFGSRHRSDSRQHRRDSRRGQRDRRGQAHTLEAVIGALLLIAALLFAMQATAVTPLSASTSNQNIENQQRAVASSLLATTAEDGSLRETLLYWNGSVDPETNQQVGFIGSPDAETSYTNETAPTEFLSTLNGTLHERQVAYNINIRYERETADGSLETSTQRLVRMGQPSDNAVTTSRTVTMYGDDELPDGTRLDEASDDEFYAPQLSSDVVGESLVYNRLEVRIVTWRM